MCFAMSTLQGEVKPNDEVIFLPTHTTANPCVGKVFTVEMHHKRVDKAGPGDNVGMNIKVGLPFHSTPSPSAFPLSPGDVSLGPFPLICIFSDDHLLTHIHIFK